MLNWLKGVFGMANVSINGRHFSGNNVNIVGRNVYVDGVKVDAGDLSTQTELEIKVTEGVLGKLDAGGSVTCGDVNGSVSTGGSLSVKGNVGGDANAGGSMNVSGSVSGKINAGGSVRVGRS